MHTKDKKDKTWKFINNTVTDFTPMGKLIRKSSAKKPPTIVFKVQCSPSRSPRQHNEWVNLYDVFVSGLRPCEGLSSLPSSASSPLSSSSSSSSSSASPSMSPASSPESDGESERGFEDDEPEKLRLDFILSSPASTL